MKKLRAIFPRHSSSNWHSIDISGASGFIFCSRLSRPFLNLKKALCARKWSGVIIVRFPLKMPGVHARTPGAFSLFSLDSLFLSFDLSCKSAERSPQKLFYSQTFIASARSSSASWRFCSISASSLSRASSPIVMPRFL